MASVQTAPPRLGPHTVTARLAYELREAATAAVWGGQHDLARRLDDRADALRLVIELRRSETAQP
jgi:hypothetical protein